MDHNNYKNRKRSTANRNNIEAMKPLSKDAKMLFENKNQQFESESGPSKFVASSEICLLQRTSLYGDIS